MTVRVVTSAQAASRDAAAIHAGTPSRTLMQRAGIAAAGLIIERFGHRLERGVLVITGPGNNGGDGWVVAQELASRGVKTHVHDSASSRTPDALAARAAALPHVATGAPDDVGLVVDALLGTGARGEPTGRILDAVGLMKERRDRGAVVVALDVPTGVDATTGQGAAAVRADLTVTFGTIKRGHLVARDVCGAVVVVDIGLGAHADLDDGAPGLVDEAAVARWVPSIEAGAHKGTRRRVVIAGGARGMAGAVILAARAASRSGIGMVRLLVDEASLTSSQVGAVEATAATWPATREALAAAVTDYAHAVLLGPGLGRDSAAFQLVEDVLAVWHGPTVLDADALTLFEGQLSRLASLLGGRPALLTPHVSEFARIAGVTTEAVLANRFDIAKAAAGECGATILLKGVPTVITSPDGAVRVSGTGTPVLATAGSGDILGGIAVTLLAQTGDPVGAAACAAWIHGRAAEIANTGRPVRGTTLQDVLDALGHAWRLSSRAPEPPVLAELADVSADAIRQT